MSTIRITKMQGAGNDFVMVNATEAPFDWDTETIRLVCNRTFGVGCDQLLVVERPQSKDADFRYRIFNQDGGEVEMCGNGARCFGVYVRHLGLTDKRTIVCETMKGLITPTVNEDDSVTVDMGAPVCTPEAVHMNVTGVAKLTRADDVLYQIRLAGRDNWVSIVSMGNPHAVMIVGDVEQAPVAEVGAAFQSSPIFTQQVNVGFLQPIDAHHAKLRVFERGVGETRACGTGACAAVVAGIRRGALQSPVQVQMPGGVLTIAWDQADASVMLTGPARVVFEADLDVEALRQMQAVDGFKL